MKTKYKILIIIPILYTIAALVIVAHVIENPIIANINPIFIDDQDPNYNWNRIVKTNQHCKGSGTFKDPYVIQRVKIIASGSDSCIEIRNSYKYFIIIDSIFINSGRVFGDAGIRLNNVTNGRILNNDCSNNLAGILIELSDNINLTDNTLINNEYAGIRLNGCSNIIVSGNNVLSNEYGIYCNVISNNILNNNQIINNRIGIYLYSSSYNSLAYNYVCDNIEDGINLMNSNDNYLFNNTLINNLYRGISLSTSSNNNLSQNYIKENQNMGIYVYYGASNNIIGNTILNNSIYGLQIYRSHYNNATENIMFYNDYGLRLSESNHCYVFQNNISYSDASFSEGIRLYYANQNSFLFNTITFNIYGFYLTYSSYNFIVENILTNNGLFLLNDSYSTNNIFENNTI